MPEKRPHIIYILSDEHRGQAMGHIGDGNLRTPVMDRLAAEGASFSRAYANCPICTPSRGTIFSGRHAHSGPVAGFFDVYKPASPSTATILRQAGYHTAYFGKWHCGTYQNQKPPLTRQNPEEYKGSCQRTPEYHRAGFQDWFGFENLNQHFNSYYYKNRDINPTKLEGYETDGQTSLAIDYLQSYEREEPLYLVLSVTPPHFPMLVPEKWQRFDPMALDLRENFTDTLENRRLLALYYAMIENLDWNMGRLMAAIERLPAFRDNTITVYISDHGEFGGSHNRMAKKEHPEEESVRIPAIFHAPGRLPAQGRIDGLFSLVDLMATTLGLVGVDVPIHNQGFDWSPALRGEACQGPDAVLLEMHNNPRWGLHLQDWRGLVTERWKYAFYEDKRELLFDLASDPFEKRNLARTDEAQRAAMERLLLQLLSDSREPYFDVLIEHGVEPDGPVIDVSTL